MQKEKKHLLQMVKLQYRKDPLGAPSVRLVFQHLLEQDLSTGGL